MTARGLVVVIVTLIIAGCASVAPKGPAVEGGAQIKWRQHHAQVAQLDQWDISGRIGVRTANTGGSANLRWKFDKERPRARPRRRRRRELHGVGSPPRGEAIGEVARSIAGPGHVRRGRARAGAAARDANRKSSREAHVSR